MTEGIEMEWRIIEGKLVYIPTVFPDNCHEKLECYCPYPTISAILKYEESGEIIGGYALNDIGANSDSILPKEFQHLELAKTAGEKIYESRKGGLEEHLEQYVERVGSAFAIAALEAAKELKMQHQRLGSEAATAMRSELVDIDKEVGGEDLDEWISILSAYYVESYQADIDSIQSQIDLVYLLGELTGQNPGTQAQLDSECAGLGYTKKLKTLKELFGDRSS